MITATVLAVFFVPVFYVAIQGLIEFISGPPTGKLHSAAIATPSAHDNVAVPGTQSH
jgi:HAE1 family hydrophobic/amphiphilic exporter-1